MGQKEWESAVYKLQSTAGQIGLNLDEASTKKLAVFGALLAEKNKVMNLTGITDPDEAAEKHFLDSLAIGRLFRPSDGQRVLDLGSGAGFPGIPLAIVFPDAEYTLADSLQKRIGFLNEVIQTLSLKGVRAVHGRAEDLGRDPRYREQYDLCVSRAVADLSILTEFCLPFVKPGGCFVSYKGADAEKEVRCAAHALQELGGEVETVDVFFLPESRHERSLILIRKAAETPERYPRRAGIPEKRPL